ncbi:hypothetical protein L202_04655 [Cryptococcus amylolentus CBS 6039]|uniref:PEBP-like protein n=2 Tax=Cryptococcus amylolentus TaxID=104669 RepID=A0A1E3HPW2_9TREE|nr:hypothetical protein L202_04655 [Cryptococcus amylolentus CBS 6039]ODN77481.1 hypothetical protein L202_04655 [Cryptococcus amylolentus CBS 6039]ODO05530.1 hypothetical protein I350_04581 [Cryptococcus amylolentus CBS 6273]
MPSRASLKLAARAISQQRRSFAATSLARNAAFEPALAPGVSPAYDAALAFISAHQSKTLAKLESFKSQLPSSPSLEQLKQLDKLEIEAYANDPAVRRTFKETNGEGAMDKKIMRWMGEKKWTKDGGLDLLMQRALQMNVVPDLLAEIPPTAPLTVSLSAPIIPGTFQLPSSFAQPPKITHQLFHHPTLPTASSPNPTALHTLLVIDPDAPNHEAHSFNERLLYMKTDVPLSVVDGQVNLTDKAVGKEILAWEPPAPEQGTPYHRYVVLVFRQTSPSSVSTVSREPFSLRSFLSEQDLTAQALTGITLFRAEWQKEEDEFINSVFREQRGVAEGAPVYSKVPKEVRYGYPMKAKQRQKEEIREQIFEEVMKDLESAGDKTVA